MREYSLTFGPYLRTSANFSCFDLNIYLESDLAVAADITKIYWRMRLAKINADSVAVNESWILSNNDVDMHQKV